MDGGGGVPREALRRRLYLTAIALGITLLWLIASTIMLTRETKVIRESAAQERRLGEARVQLQNVLIFLGNAETGQRGYLLTAKEEYLVPYSSAVSGIAELLDRLDRSTVDIPAHGVLLKDIRTQTDLKLAELAETIRLARAGDRAAALALVQTDSGEKIMERLRTDIADFGATAVVRQRLSADAVAHRALQRERLAVLASCALVLAVGLAAIQVILVLAAQHRYERALSTSERRHRALVEEQTEVVTQVRPDGVLAFANPAFSRLFDLPAGRAEGRQLLEWIVAADRGLMARSLACALTSTEPVAVACRVQSLGQERWLSWSLHAQTSEGNHLVHAVARDVTERRHLELALEAKERFISHIADSVPARIAYVGGDGRFQFVNRQLADRFGLPAQKIVGTALLEVAGPDSRAGWEKVVTAALAGESLRYDYDDTIDGQLRKIEAHVIPDVAPNAQVQGFVAISTDITHLKRIEQELRELTAVFDNTTDFVAQTDWQGKVLFINKSARRALGIAPDAPLADHSFREFYTPQTNERFVQEIVPAVKRDLVWLGETEVVLRDGRVVPVNHMVIGHLDGQGRVSRYSSVMRDISAEVTSRRELARQTATLNTVIEAIPAMVAVFDRDLRVVLVNRAYERWRGLSRELLVGRLVQQTLDAAEYEKSCYWAQRALAGETVSYEEDYPQTCEVRHVQMTYVPLRMPDGIGGFFAVAQDITQHREENLRLSLLSTRDPLTGVLNRAGFEQLMHARISEGSGATLAVIYIDLDHFKPVNDTHGHAAGDQVLREFAARVQRQVRPTDAVARLGGDEFAVILLGIRDAADAAMVADKIVAVAREPFLVAQNIRVSISASAGVACDADAAGGWQALIAQADKMAYEAKAAGRGRVAVA